MDVALPPPAFLRRRGDEQAAAAATASARNASRRWLAMHAEGGVSPPEYDLRRALSTLYAPDWWENKGKVPPFGDELYVRKKMARPEHAEALFASKFCLVVEGFAPWTPRLAEAIAAGCVPAFLSPAYRPPFADVLDWPAFSATLRRDDVGTLRDALAKLDHAALHANLLKVRDLFAFHVDAGGAGGALPLAVFEMWRRARARARGGDRYAGRDGRPGVVAALVAARARARRARGRRRVIRAGRGRAPMARGTIKPETPEDVLLTFVGELASNDDFDIDTQDRMNSVGLFPNHMLDAEMFEGYIDNVPRLQELIDGADIEVCIGFMQRFQPQITSMASLLAFYHACLMREPRGSHAKIITYQRFWVSRGHGPGAAVSRTK
ncbi:SET domain-containing protein [Aureococcus anophagefferens]|nr:SET domain-containing protein [Aureococcus anophagefferens]